MMKSYFSITKINVLVHFYTKNKILTEYLIPQDRSSLICFSVDCIFGFTMVTARNTALHKYSVQNGRSKFKTFRNYSKFCPNPVKTHVILFKFNSSQQLSKF